jgi:hypothetical protein
VAGVLQDNTIKTFAVSTSKVRTSKNYLRVASKGDKQVERLTRQGFELICLKKAPHFGDPKMCN